MQILGACQQPTILATSRSPLDLPGESVLPLAPLAVPVPEGDPESCPSVQLFLQRCRDAGATVGATDLSAVAELCRRVDGLPLAIEIAAARARTMSIAEIVGRLDGSMDVLDRPRFRGDPRHRSVADTIRWSYDLLSPDAAGLLEELAVFAGPLSGASARAVSSVDDPSRFDALLDELTHASLVAVDTSGAETRYRLLETVRQFALVRLRRRGALESTYDRFADHVVTSVREITRGATRSWRPGLLRELVAAFDDLAEALHWCTAHDDDPHRAYSLCASLWAVVHQGRADDAAELARRTLARWPDRESPAAARCVAALATAEYVTGHPQRALDLVTPILAEPGQLGLVAMPLRRVEGQARRALGDTEGALAAFREGVRVGVELEAPSLAMELEIAAALVSADRGDVASSVDALGEIVQRAAASGSVLSECWARAAWGWVLLRVEPATALPVIEEGLAEARRIDYPIAVAVDLRSLAYARLLLGDLAGAVEVAGELLDDLLERGALSNSRLLVDVTAVLAHRVGHLDWASLATTARALPITTLAAAQYELVPLPEVDAPLIERHQVIIRVRAVLEELSSPVTDTDREPELAGRIERRGDTCEIGFAGGVVSLRQSKGLTDVVRLIEAGGREVHCLDLAGAGVEESSTGQVLDETARRQYERRIRELQEEIDEAETNNDMGRAYKSQVELDAIIDHLTAALGMGNKTREAGGTTERARSAVTHRIRATIRQIEKVNPHLGRHLRHAINTGTYCSYRPEQPTAWRIT